MFQMKEDEVTTHFVDKSAGGRSQLVSVVQDVTSRHCALKLCRVQAIKLYTKGRAIKIIYHRADEKTETFSYDFRRYSNLIKLPQAFSLDVEIFVE